MIDTYTVIAPAHWAPALINGDDSGIDDDAECGRIHAFEVNQLGPISDCGEDFFVACPRLDSDTPNELAGDYAEYTVIVTD